MGELVGIAERWPVLQSDIMQTSIATWDRYLDFLFNLGIDLVAIVIMAYGIYFRRHGRRDLLMVYAAFNIGLFIVLSVITINETSMAVGFGLFAILSLIRLRSEPFSNIELGYFFFAMALAVINAMQVGGSVIDAGNQAFVLSMNAIGLLTLFVVDHPALQRGVGFVQLVLDRVYDDDSVLEADLAQRLRAQIIGYSISRIDYVQDITVLEVRYIRSLPDASRHVSSASIAGRETHAL